MQYTENLVKSYGIARVFQGEVCLFVCVYKQDRRFLHARICELYDRKNTQFHPLIFIAVEIFVSQPETMVSFRRLIV